MLNFTSVLSEPAESSFRHHSVGRFAARSFLAYIRCAGKALMDRLRRGNTSARVTTAAMLTRMAPTTGSLLISVPIIH